MIVNTVNANIAGTPKMHTSNIVIILIGIIILMGADIILKAYIKKTLKIKLLIIFNNLLNI